MKMKRRGKVLTTVIVALLLIAAIYIVAIAADYGSADDPLISLSYLKETLLPDIMKQVDSRVDAAVSSWNHDSVQTYSVLQLSKGQVLVGGEGAEIIFRSGAAVCVSPYADIGLSDATQGIELLNGGALVKNHLYIIPRADGRGVKAAADQNYFMVRGTYQIK
jgi:hypothetical protein